MLAGSPAVQPVLEPAARAIYKHAFVQITVAAHPKPQMTLRTRCQTADQEGQAGSHPDSRGCRSNQISNQISDWISDWRSHGYVSSLKFSPFSREFSPFSPHFSPNTVFFSIFTVFFSIPTWSALDLSRLFCDRTYGHKNYCFRRSEAKIHPEGLEITPAKQTTISSNIPHFSPFLREFSQFMCCCPKVLHINIQEFSPKYTVFFSKKCAHRGIAMLRP